MKLSFISPLTVLVLFLSCQKAPELILTGPSSIELNADGSSSSITFTANRDWRVSSSDAWVTLSPSSGTASEGPVTVTVRCNANTTYDDRTATVTISMEELSQTVTVRQPANLGIVLPTQAFDLQSGAKNIDVTVQANVDYSVDISANWIKQTGTKALTSKTLTFNIEENKTYDAREGKITIKPKQAGVAEQVISVKQAQKDALNLEKTSYDMPHGGGEIEIKVEANVSFDVTPNADWIHYTQTKALSSSMVCLKVDENTTYSSRQGTVEIKQQNGSLKHTITVNQAGRIAVTSVELDKTSLSLMEGESEIITATVKPDNATDKTITWASSNETVATVDENGKVIAVKAGESSITATAGDIKATCVVIVKYEIVPVDLGLSVLWASANIEANAPGDSGNYYAWGELKPKDIYEWSTYIWCPSGIAPDPLTYDESLTKYNYVDNKTELEMEDDVAHVVMGDAWRLPTETEIDELIMTKSNANYKWTLTKVDDRMGSLVEYLVNGNSIFLPYVGTIGENGPMLLDNVGYYWSSSRTNYFDDAWMLYVSSASVTKTRSDRCYARSVRPVKGFVKVKTVDMNASEELRVGDTYQLRITIKPDNAYDKTVTWNSSDNSIATVEDGLITAVKVGTAKITAKVGDITKECTVSVFEPYTSVDLGLSVNWATINVGAKYLCEPGEPFSWGETKIKEDYSWNTYKWGKSETYLKKYITKEGYYNDVDNLTRLESNDDVANVLLGNGWRVPTIEEWNELVTKCTWTWEWKTKDDHGIYGYTIVGPNNNIIFLPCAGGTKGEYKQSNYNNGSYWSSDVNQEEPIKAYELFFSESSYFTTSVARYMGNAIRGVKPK